MPGQNQRGKEITAVLAPSAGCPPESYSAALALALVQVAGIGQGFAVPGADINPFLAAAERTTGFSLCFAAHEAMAVAMADAFWRRSGRFALAAACGGPGVANLLAGAWSVAAEGTPVLFVTGAPPIASRVACSAGDAAIDGRGFTALGIASIPLNNLSPGAAAEMALHYLLRGEPVHLQLPLCIGLSPPPAFGSPGRTPGDRLARPLPLPPLRPRLLFAVGGHALAQAPRIRRLAERHGIPVVTDMVARGLVDERTELAFGHAGFMPDPRVMAIADPAHPLAAEQVVLIGASPSLRRIFAPSTVVLPNALEQHLNALESSLAEATPESYQARRAWLHEVSGLAPQQSQAPPADGPLDHATIAAVLAAMAPTSTAFVIDAGGFHQAATAHLRASRPGTILTQSALVAMGWSCGAAIGASIADPAAPVVALLGDGCFAMHGLELATALRYRANITYVIAWNGIHGSVARDHGFGAMAGVAIADPAAVVQACRLPCHSCASVADLRTAFRRAASTPGPQAIVARVAPAAGPVPGRPTGIDWLDGTVRRC